MWFLVLFASVFVVNTGYYLISVSTSLYFAIRANRISYLGSVFLPLSMAMVIFGESNLRYKKWLPKLLVAISLFTSLLHFWKAKLFKKFCTAI